MIPKPCASHFPAKPFACRSPLTNPSFPIAFPTDQLVAPENGSLLRVYFAGDERQTAAFENDAGNWSATTKFSATVKNASAVLAGLGDAETNPIELPETTWLTAFEDKTWPGGTEDLYFTPHSDQDEVHPPPIIRKRPAYFPLPLDVILGIGMLIFLIRRRRQKAVQEAA